MTLVAFLIGRFIFGAFFAWHGFDHVRREQMMTQYARMKRVPAPQTAVLASGLMLMAGGVSIIAGYQSDIGVALLVIFLVVSSFFMHNFWAVADPQARSFERVNFEKNMALAGAALSLLAIPRPWPFGIG